MLVRRRQTQCHPRSSTGGALRGSCTGPQPARWQSAGSAQPKTEAAAKPRGHFFGVACTSRTFPGRALRGEAHYSANFRGLPRLAVGRCSARLRGRLGGLASDRATATEPLFLSDNYDIAPRVPACSAYPSRFCHAGSETANGEMAKSRDKVLKCTKPPVHLSLLTVFKSQSE